jgi:acyl-CoA thioester hydrolase
MFNPATRFELEPPPATIALMSAIHTYSIHVPPSSIDANGHVNNIEFVRWMQEAAVSHADKVGCTAATQQAGATWVVRSHQIEYLRPAFEGQRIDVLTWVADFRRAFSTRKYKFVRPSDNVVLARGATDWVFIDSTTGRPKSVPPEIQGMFEIVADEPR